MRFAEREAQAFTSVAEMNNHLEDVRYSGQSTQIDPAFQAFVDACLQMSDQKIAAAAAPLFNTRLNTQEGNASR
jgi:hypothetical protein